MSSKYVGVFFASVISIAAHTEPDTRPTEQSKSSPCDAGYSILRRCVKLAQVSFDTDR